MRLRASVSLDVGCSMLVVGCFAFSCCWASSVFTRRVLPLNQEVVAPGNRGNDLISFAAYLRIRRHILAGGGGRRLKRRTGQQTRAGGKRRAWATTGGQV